MPGFRSLTKMRSLAMLLAFVPFATAAHGQTATTAPAPAAAVDLSAAIAQLSAGGYAGRQRAFAAIEHDLAMQDADLLRPQDPEVAARLAMALQFQQRLISWVLEIRNLPAAAQEAQLALLRRKEMLPVLANLFAPDEQARINGLHDLAAVPNAAADPLLDYFLQDESNAVCLAATEVLWDRPASAESVHAVWNIALGDRLSAALTPPTPAAIVPLTFRGTAVSTSMVSGGRSMSLNVNRGRALAAGELLAHWKGPVVEALLADALHQVSDRLNAGGGDGASLSFLRLREPLAALCGLAVEGHFTSAEPALVALATAPLAKNREMTMGPMGHYCSVRTEPLAALVQLSGQDPNDYGLSAAPSQVIPIAGWTSESKDGEARAIDKLTAWWQRHSGDAAAK